MSRRAAGPSAAVQVGSGGNNGGLAVAVDGNGAGGGGTGGDHAPSLRRQDSRDWDHPSSSEQQRQERERQRLIQAEIQEELHPKRRPAHAAFECFSHCTVLSSAGMGLGQVLGIVFQTVGPIQIVLRMYVIALCILAILNEVQFTVFARDSRILRMWITRGLFYAFIGLLGLEENDTSSTKNSNVQGYHVSLVFVRVVAWCMVACGLSYAVMGCLCLQIYYNRLRSDYRSRLERAETLRGSRTLMEMSKQQIAAKQAPAARAPSATSSPPSAFAGMI